MKFTVITLFPKIFDSYLGVSILKRAQEKKKIVIEIIDIRKFTSDKHHTADENPYGGGPGMAMKAEPILKACQSVKWKVKSDKRRTIILSAAGKKFTSKTAKYLSLATDHLVLIAGHYEGIDERVKKILSAQSGSASGGKTEELSIGDYVLTGGELPAMVLIDAISRHIPGVLGKGESLEESRFGVGVPVYTRPETLIFKGKKYTVPRELVSGHHAKINRWRENHKKRV